MHALKAPFLFIVAASTLLTLPTPTTAGDILTSLGLNSLVGIQSPTFYDVEQCASRKTFPTAAFILSANRREGCALTDPSFRIFNTTTKTLQPFSRSSPWKVEIRTLTDKQGAGIVASVVTTPGNDLYYCFAQGHLGANAFTDDQYNDMESQNSTFSPDVVDALSPPTTTSSLPTSTADASAPTPTVVAEPAEAASLVDGYKFSLAFVKSAAITPEFFDLVDKGLVGYQLIVRNVPNPLDEDELFQAGYFDQMVRIAWKESPNGNPFSSTSTDRANALRGLIDVGHVPRGARHLDLYFVTDYPYYAVGQITLAVFQAQLQYRLPMTFIFNITFFLALGFAVVVPIALLLETRMTRQTRGLHVVDLVHHQGPRYVRATAYSVTTAMLYFVFQWIKATAASDEGNLIPLWPHGISAEWFSTDPKLRSLKGLVFMALFLAVGVFFWPLFLAYAHASSFASRTAAVLGLCVALNLVGLRFSVEYLNSKPWHAPERKFVQEAPEVLCYTLLLVYFAFNTISPSHFERKYEKTHLKDIIYVRTLFRHIDLPDAPLRPPAPAPPRTILGHIHAWLRRLALMVVPTDNRPIWLKGRKPVTTLQECRLFLTSFRTPVRLVAAVMMMCLFTYFLLVAQLYAILDANPTTSCRIGLFGERYVEVLASAFELMGRITNAPSFGTPLGQTLRDLTETMRREVYGANVVESLYEMLKGSVFVSMVLSALLLLYNTIDFSLTVRKDMRRLRLGDYSRVGHNVYYSTSLAVQFVGTQVGYVYMGSLYMMTILLFLNFCISLFVKYSFFRQIVWRFALQEGLVVISFAVGFALVILQRYIVDLFFIARIKEDPDEHPDPENAVKGKDGSVTINTKFWLRRLVGYNHVDYWFLFPNLITGLLSFLSNLAMMILGSALFAYRLDKKTEYTVPLMGTKTWIYFSWLLQEHHHTNPILLIFVRLLHDAQRDRDPNAGATFPRREATSTRRTRRVLANRWKVLYTLLRNPSLTRFRKHVVRDTYLREFIARTEAPLLREQETQRVRAELESLEASTRDQLRDKQRASVRDLLEGGTLPKFLTALRRKRDDAAEKRPVSEARDPVAEPMDRDTKRIRFLSFQPADFLKLKTDAAQEGTETAKRKALRSRHLSAPPGSTSLETLPAFAPSRPGAFAGAPGDLSTPSRLSWAPLPPSGSPPSGSPPFPASPTALHPPRPTTDLEEFLTSDNPDTIPAPAPSHPSYFAPTIPAAPKDTPPPNRIPPPRTASPANRATPPPPPDPSSDFLRATAAPSDLPVPAWVAASMSGGGVADRLVPPRAASPVPPGGHRTPPPRTASPSVPLRRSAAALVPPAEGPRQPPPRTASPAGGPVAVEEVPGEAPPAGPPQRQPPPRTASPAGGSGAEGTSRVVPPRGVSKEGGADGL
ncbi:hypothetical protein HDU96_010665 [Phlyctochytrium bullatum]|nr:hypothetical protein HDU96_010665 [Phlyctochytrium bullatum]